MNTFSNLSLAWPYLLLALPLPLLVYFLVPPYSGRGRRALLVPDTSPFKNLAHSKTAGGFSWMMLLALLVWILAVLASARPQWLGEPVSSQVTGRDLMLSIDISGSMRETDLFEGDRQLSRMEVVRKVGSDFISRRTGDRVGLIMFGSQAYVQTPLTFDHETVQHFLGEAQIGLAGRSTAIGDAIGLGVKRLRDRPEQTRVLILLTDGANSAGVVQPLEAAQVAAANQIRIHTIGVGSEPRGFSGFRTQRSELDEETLQEIASVTGGQYFRARNVRELEQIYSTIDTIEPVESDEEIFRPLKELFHWPLGLSLFASALLLWLHGWRRA